MAEVKCFLIEPTSMAAIGLRRYVQSSHGDCPKSGRGYHNATVIIGAAAITQDDPDGAWDVRYEQPGHEDVRWPAACACGHLFAEGDEWQLWKDRIYVRTDTREAKPHGDWKQVPGAMWETPWLPYKGPDGKCWTVTLPNGSEWTIDAHAEGREGWKRTGEAPDFTVTPSILSHAIPEVGQAEYHGFLTGGILRD